jgi:DNA-binding GntR family transcriptional regulator
MGEHGVKMAPIERPRSLTDTVLAELRSRIVNGDFDLGAPLFERQLSESLGVSKTPVREALAQLRLEGLVRIYPQRGAFVFTLSAREVIALCELRQTLESGAMRLAYERRPTDLVEGLSGVVREMEAARTTGDIRAYLAADTAYHHVLFACCDSPLIAEAYDRYAGKIAALRNHLAAKPQHTDLSFAEHIEMRDRLAAEAIDEALVVLDRHIERTKATYAAWIDDIAEADRNAKTPQLLQSPATRAGP